MLGQGTFGQVVKVEDTETKEQKAVKVIKNKPAYHNQALLEIKILKTVSPSSLSLVYLLLVSSLSVL
jgi:dual specificity protein kinase YAK1